MPLLIASAWAPIPNLGIIIQTGREGDDDENDDDSYENATASASPIFLPFQLPTIELDESLRGGFPLSQEKRCTSLDLHLHHCNQRCGAPSNKMPFLKKKCQKLTH